MLHAVYAASYAALALLVALPAAVAVPVYVQMIAQSTLIIVIASIAAARRHRARALAGDAAEERDVIGREQAYRFPLVASSALFGMFLAFKYLPNEWVSFLLTLYGVTFGALALAGVVAAFISPLAALPPLFNKQRGLADWFSFTLCDLLGLIPAVPVAYWYYVTRSWLPNNILACALALSAVELLAIPDFQTAAVLLSGLFFYDIFWVFGSERVIGANVMVNVAKQFQGPIKLVFPRFVGAGKDDSSMLGLGDIVIPGLFVALMLRFDIRHLSPTAPVSETPRDLPYYVAAVASYVAGLVATYVALTVFEAAQPALLYLVPFCLLTVLAVAAVRRQLSELVAYNEEDDTDAKDHPKKIDSAAPQPPAEQQPVEDKKDQ